MMEIETYNNVWEALCDDKAEALNKKMRCDMMINITTIYQQWNLTQAEAAKRLGITQPRLNDLLKGKMSKFSLDALLSLAVNAGLKVELTIKEAA